MYESFFALHQRPFSAAPLVARYVPLAGMEQARQTLARCVERAEGPGLVVGPAGSGKTLLCYLLAEQLQQRFRPVLLFSGNLASRRDLLQAVLFELDLPYRGLEEGELRLNLLDYLRSPQSGEGLLLIVDEAHTLPIKLLEELRTLTNVVQGGQPRVRLVLVGGTMLEERLASPKLESFSQRLAARCYLEPLQRDETWHYVRSQIGAAGGNVDAMFTPAAIDAIYKASDGIPRLINQICDQALLRAAQQQQCPVLPGTVERAWADLQQLPAPWSDTAAESSYQPLAAEVVEFGGLDEDDLMETRTADPAAGEEGAPTDYCQPSEAASPAPECQQEIVVSSTQIGLEALQKDLAILSNELEEWGAGATEVELVFDDLAAEPAEAFEVSLSLSAADALQQPQWTSTEFCEAEAAAANTEGASQLGFEQGAAHVNESSMEEELVVDRYAALDARKSQGRPANPYVPTVRPVNPPASASIPTTEPEPRKPAAAEKSLTLAEALVQHAAAMEQAGWLGDSPLAGQFSEVAGGGTGNEGWTSIDLLPPTSDFTPPARTPAEPLTGGLEFLENDCTVDSAPRECLPLFAVQPAEDNAEEPQLIVIEEETTLQVQVQPQATPVKRSEYRQLFARLRRS